MMGNLEKVNEYYEKGFDMGGYIMKEHFKSVAYHAETPKERYEANNFNL